MTSPTTAAAMHSGWRRLAGLGAAAVAATAVAWFLGLPLPMTARGWLPVVAAGVAGLLVWAFVLPKVLPSFKAQVALLVAVSVVPAWILVSPLFTDDPVDEPPPVALAQPGAGGGGDASGDGGGGNAAAAAGPVRAGTLEGIGHSATGAVGLYELADGTHVVRLEEVDIQNGPDLFVYLVPEPGQADDSGGVNLGRLKGNVGSSNYPVPADVDVEKFSTVLVWCRAFSTPFANATLAAA